VHTGADPPPRWSTDRSSPNFGKWAPFDPAALNEVRPDGSGPLGTNGFAPGSLLSPFASPQTFLHNAAVISLADVLNNVHQDRWSGYAEQRGGSCQRSSNSSNRSTRLRCRSSES